MAHGSYFVFGYEVQDLLFKGFSATSIGGLIGLCLFSASLTLIYEGVKVIRQRLFNLLPTTTTTAVEESSSDERLVDAGSPLSDRSERSILTRIGFAKANASWRKMHCLQTILYTVQVTLAYTLMLIVMAYNAWLCLSILLASGLAYFVFGSSTLVTTPLILPLDLVHEPQIS